ncbi:MAG: hypothetical protein Q9219_004496 [cf. Caloplaca sp. 3 TL-2023]
MIQGLPIHRSNGDQALPMRGSFSAIRRIHRLHPQTTDVATHEKRGQHQNIKSEEPHIKRQPSKGRLLGIFNRTRSTKASMNALEHRHEGEHLTHRGQGISYNGKQGATSHPVEDPVTAELPPVAESPKQQPPKAKRSKSIKQGASNKSILWDPPPLFQAYPQSVKHGKVYAPNTPADTILRLRNSRYGSPPVELVPKVYVLVTSGYLLQYSGEGSFDRSPEKIMPIGQDSAAFASDAISGKHWVLQVSHASDENGTPILEKSSLAQRLGFRGDIKKCSVSNLLLVLDNPEELENWLGTVRREIEAWGGKKYQSDSAARPSADEVARTLQQKPSRRYLVKRDPNQFSNFTNEMGVAGEETSTRVDPAAGARKHSTATQDSVHSPSTSNMTASTDQNILDRLRNSPRMSYISTGAKTHSTSQDPSPLPSPTNVTFHLDDLSFGHEQSEKTGLPATNPNQPSRSSIAMYGPSDPQSPSGTPNFSIPSFSKRNSGAYYTPPLTATSSSTSNPSRLPTSPPTIEAQRGNSHDAEPKVLEATATDNTRSDACLQATTSDRALPRRFSSLEYSRGVSPMNDNAYHTPSPHPPPTSALPALPPQSSSKLPSTSPKNLRRPISMQIHPVSLPSSLSDPHNILPTIPSPSADAEPLPPRLRNPPLQSPPSSTIPISSSSEQFLLPPSKVLNRRSMPHLSPPPFAPPTGPLPTPPVPRLPPIKLSSGSLRKSMERPLKAGLGVRTEGVVEGEEG